MTDRLSPERSTYQPGCPFCRIVAGEAPADVVHQDDVVTAFRDHRPQAPVHILVVPNDHITSLADLDPYDSSVLGRVFSVINRLALEHGVAERGYRVVVNSGKMAGQTVPHLHFHLLGGRTMR